MIHSRLILPSPSKALRILCNGSVIKSNRKSVVITRLFNSLANKNIKVNDTFGVKSGITSNGIRARGGGRQLSNVCNISEIDTRTHRVVLAIGTNEGDRYYNIMKSMAMLEETTQEQIIGQSEKEFQHAEALIRIVATSFLRETPPMYLTNQPTFLNGAIEIETCLSPHALLKRLKDIESEIGRDLNAIRNGPRPIDLDIIYYGVDEIENEQQTSIECGGSVIETSDLIVPHPRISEREFVLAPLCDLGNNIVHPIIKATSRDMLQSLTKSANYVDSDVSSTATLTIPLPRSRFLKFDQVLIMGILNVTPDSFSDGGNYKGSVDLAVEEALRMESSGASIIDIGGESTRPGAKEVEIDVELQRTIPVIKKIREVSNIPISIDTRHATVAREAILAGADIVNDVSGGTHDPLMLQTVKKLQVPIVLMHMRGTPETMQKMTQYDNVVKEVSDSLLQLSKNAEKAGIPRWLHILDPGIGFAKDLDQNLSLIKNTDYVREAVMNCPLLLGPSRKGFIGKITGETIAEKRDFGTLVSCLMGILSKDRKLAPTILRVHNVEGLKQGTRMFEAIMNAK